ncbi:hypothetical protein MKX01_029848 [Papaver californicum]|nr:hypothetical protein MKX01_029848 [Papaver californicum]
MKFINTQGDNGTNLNSDVSGSSNPSSITTEQENQKESKLRSKVWDGYERFTKTNPDDPIKVLKRARCKLCKDDFSGDTGAGTLHLNRHTKSCQKKQRTDSSQTLIARNAEACILDPRLNFKGMETTWSYIEECFGTSAHKIRCYKEQISLISQKRKSLFAEYVSAMEVDEQVKLFRIFLQLSLVHSHLYIVV